jgi:molecular chaperone GrpE
MKESKGTKETTPEPLEANGDRQASSNNETPISADALAELQKKASERDTYLDLLQRTRADFENYQKQLSRRQEQERPYIHLNLLKEILPVVDNLERATAAAQQAGEKGPLVQGVAMVLSQLNNFLRSHNVTRIEAEGQTFDPNRHQAVAQVPSGGKPANTVVNVLEQGYLLNDRVLRPARVTVAAAEDS